MNYPNTLRHGAKGGVAASCHHLLMEVQHSLLINCSLFQGAETSVESKSAAEHLAIVFPLDTIKTLVASHVQIGHVRRMPYLLAAGFRGAILCSEPSAKLLPIVLEDAFKLNSGRDHKQIECYIKLIKRCIIALPCKTWFTLNDAQSRVRHYLKPFLENEALQRLGYGNRSSGRCHRRERSVPLRSNRQLTEIHAARPAVQGSVCLPPGPRHRGAAHLGVWPERRQCRSGRATL